jgi:hypothetical protein
MSVEFVTRNRLDVFYFNLYIGIHFLIFQVGTGLMPRRL